MKDGIIWGGGNSRTLKSSIDASISWSSFLEMLRAGTLPVDLGGTVSEGWKQIGTPLNKSTLLSDSAVASLGILKEDPTVSDAFERIAELLYGEKYPVVVQVTSSGEPVAGIVVPGLKSASGEENVVTNSSGVATGFSDTPKVVIDYDSYIDVQGRIGGTAEKGVPLILELELDFTIAANLTSSRVVRFARAKTVDIYLISGGGGGGGGSFSAGRGGSGGRSGGSSTELIASGGATGSDTGASAGGGGGNGSRVSVYTGIDVSDKLFTDLSAIVGAGGKGGAGGTKESPNGEEGSAGGTTSFLGYSASSISSYSKGGAGSDYGDPGSPGTDSTFSFTNPFTGKIQYVGGGGGGGGSYDSSLTSSGGSGGSPSGANGGDAGKVGSSALANTGGGGGGGGGSARSGQDGQPGGDGGSGSIWILVTSYGD